MSHTAYIGVGTNLGDRIANFRTAVERVGEIEETRVTRQSSLYESEPIGKARNWFLNGVLEITTELDAKALLKQLQKIETGMGRKKSKAKASVSRIIDLDILLFDGQVIESRTLKVPHPELPNRRFVLLPLSELAPALKHPVSAETISTLSVTTSDKTRVLLFKT